MTMGQRGDASTEEAIAKEFKLNLPPFLRYCIYLNDLSPLSIHHPSDDNSSIYYKQSSYSGIKLMPLGGNALYLKYPYLGISFQNKEKVSKLLPPKIKSTLILAIGAIVFASIIGILMGIFAALHHNTIWDRITVGISILGISIPSYFLAILLSMYIGYYMHDIWGLNFRGDLFDYDDLGEHKILMWQNLILPIIALGLRPIALITQMTRNSMLDVLSQDYIRTATAKGLSRNNVIFKHALRNALNPVFTSISGWFGALLAGAYFIEIIFDLKGLGHLTVSSLMKFDFPVVMGCALFIAFTFVIINIFVDIIYGVIDPRVSMK
jgi:peptide/nickel transport system permease protein